MWKESQLSEHIPIPTSALVCPSRNQLNLILQAFVERKRLFKYHERLNGVITKILVNCFHPSQRCSHTSHTWLTPTDCHYVRVHCSYQCTVLNLAPGDRVPVKVKSIDSRGLVCESSSDNLTMLVYNNSSASRSIPDFLWRPGSFTMLVFEGVHPQDGPYGTIAPESIEQNEAFGEAPSMLLTDDPEPESIFELETTCSSPTSSKSLTKSTRKNKKA